MNYYQIKFKKFGFKDKLYINIEKMTVIDEYIELCNKYNKVYDKCIVLYQLGSFYEVYGYKEDNKLKGANVQNICTILDIQCTRRNKSVTVVSKSNPNMAGLPLVSANKFIDILVNNDYTVVLVEQTSPPPTVKREVTKIISPSTNMESIPSNHDNNNYLACLYISNGYVSKNKNPFIVGSLTYIDINTNTSYIAETYEEDTQLNLEDIYKNIIITSPSEIVIFTDESTKKNDKLMNSLNEFVKNIPVQCIHNRINTVINENFFKLSYQTAVLKKVFKNTGLLSVIEYLDLERHLYSVVSFTYLMQFIYEHDEKLLIGLKKPIFIENQKYLALINNVAENLNIISKNKSSAKTASLLNLLNNCKTSIGKRHFKQQLLNPLTNVAKIKQRYDLIDYFIKDDFYEICRVAITNIFDLERLFKRLMMQTLQPCEFVSINTSLTSLQKLYAILEKNDCNFENLHWSAETQIALDEFISYYQEIFNFEYYEIQL